MYLIRCKYFDSFTLFYLFFGSGGLKHGFRKHCTEAPMVLNIKANGWDDK